MSDGLKTGSAGWRRGLLWLVFCACLLTAQARANGSPAEVCDRAARSASEETGVPLDVLRAITRTETGRGTAEAMEPWPWTVNLEGSGIWFDTEAQAQRYVFQHFRNGARSFDIGCFQINYKWHGHAFNSIEEMFDPLLNARYAARFLKDLHAEHGDWTQAVGTYHSRTQKYAQRYLDRYAQVHQNLPEETGGPVLSRGNGFPLLSGTSAQSRAGSLVPVTQGAGRSLLLAGRGG